MMRQCRPNLWLRGRSHKRGIGTTAVGRGARISSLWCDNEAMPHDDLSTTFTGLVFIATSLDGFIARPSGDIGWLIENGDPGDTGYIDFMSEVDLLVMGRGTYEKAITFDSWPYVGRRVLLLSKSITTSSDDRVELHNSLDTLLKAIGASNAHRVYVDGGKVIQTFLKAGLIQEITITQLPLLLGDGIPLFGPIGQDVALSHVSTKVLSAGFVQSTYKVVGSQFS